MSELGYSIVITLVFGLALVLGVWVRATKAQESRKKRGTLKYIRTSFYSTHSRYSHSDWAEIEFELDGETVVENLDRFVYERNYKAIESMNEEVSYEEIWETSALSKTPYFVKYEVPKIKQMIAEFNERYYS